MDPIVLRVAARFAKRVPFPREFYLPQEVKGSEPLNPKGTDLYVWKYEQTGRDGQVQFCAVAFVGKQSKPIWNTIFRSEQRRDEAIDEEAANRRRVVEDKEKRQKERKDFQHGLQEGDILYSSWGYDQTNVDFYQVTEVMGKDVTVREIGKRTVGGQGSPSEKVMAEPDEFIGPPMRKRPQGQGKAVYIKINSVQTAHEWDGSPLHQTGSGYGH